MCYVNRFLHTRRPDDDINVVNVNLERWVVDHAGPRTHCTTRKQPLRVFFDDERPALLPLPAERYEVIPWRKVKVHQDAHVMLRAELVRRPHAGEQVDIGRPSARRALRLGVVSDDLLDARELLLVDEGRMLAR